MQLKTRRAVVSLALVASTLGSVAWSSASHACVVDPYIGSICIMAWPTSAAFGNGQYVAATGQTVAVSTNQALYAVIGNTYGGNTSNFMLPDLRGRVIIGAGQYAGPGGPIIYNYGLAGAGGNPSATISLANIPGHTHALGSGVTVQTGSGTLAANTTIGTLAASTVIGTLAANTTLMGLNATLKAGAGAGATQDATNASLSSVSGGKTLMYNTAAPTVSLNSTSISINGSPSTSLTGSPSTTLTGAPATTLSGNPAVAVGGQTNVAGGGGGGVPQPFPIMQPYMPMPYYIAVNGMFPVRD